VPSADRSRQAVPRRPKATPRRRLRPRITVHAALFVTLLVVAASLLVAAAQGPGTIEPALAARPTQPPDAIGDSAVQVEATATPRPAAIASAAPSPTGPVSLRPEQLKGYRWPLRRQGRITSFYDYRDSGFLAIDGKRIHEGLDMTTDCGDAVWAAHTGTVLAAGRRFGPFFGFNEPLDAFYRRLERTGRMTDLPIVVVIDDGNGYRSAYVHLEDATVKPGQRVKAGQTIGHLGATGNASGCHLHYELIRMDGPWMNVAKERVQEDRYPRLVRERVDPLRVLSLRDKDAPSVTGGLERPKDPPRLRD
jgi:murein DD-endopeptidase MepM/ murein hydrolase activator NlpD